MSKPIVKLVNVTKIYRLGSTLVKALDNVNMEIEGGEFISVMGPSGSGKTTLLNIIGCMDKPSYGEVYVDGVDITRLGERELTKVRSKKIGFVFQFFNLISTLTALENVQLPMLLQGKGYGESVYRAASLLHLVGLGDRLNHRPNELSGGERQRVAIARALANDPSIILADEPTGNLDTKTGLEVIEIMREVNEVTGKTFIIVTHDPLVSSKTERTVNLSDGKIVSGAVGEELVKDRATLAREEAEKLKRELLMLSFLKERIGEERYREKRRTLVEKIKALRGGF